MSLLYRIATCCQVAPLPYFRANCLALCEGPGIPQGVGGSWIEGLWCIYNMVIAGSIFEISLFVRTWSWNETIYHISVRSCRTFSILFPKWLTSRFGYGYGIPQRDWWVKLIPRTHRCMWFSTWQTPKREGIHSTGPGSYKLDWSIIDLFLQMTWSIYKEMDK